MSLVQGGIEKALSLLGSAPTVAAQKAHLDWLRDQLVAAEKRLQELESENTQLLRENRELRKEIESVKVATEYVDLGSCLIKSNPRGGYFKTPLCPSCKQAFSDFGGDYACGKCSIMLNSGQINKDFQDFLLKSNS